MKPLMKLLTGITLGILLGASVDAAVGTFTFKTSGASDTVEAVDLVYPQRVPEANSVSTSSIADGSVTPAKLSGPIPVANGGTGATTAAAGLAALGGASLNGSSTVDFAAKDLNVAGVATFTGFVRLGDLAPLIKLKVLQGGTGGAQGDDSVVAHGIATSATILGATCVVKKPDGVGIPPGNTLWPGHHFNFYYTATLFVVSLSATDSSCILTTPYTIMVWYTE